MTQTDWLLHVAPGAGALAALMAQAALYVALIGAAALFDLYRKNF
jgi:hypothetical protein